MALDCAGSRKRLLRLHDGKVLQGEMRVTRMAAGEVLRGRRRGRVRCRAGRRCRRWTRLKDRRVVEVALRRHDCVCASRCEAFLDIAIEEEISIGDDVDGNCLFYGANLFPVRDALCRV